MGVTPNPPFVNGLKLKANSSTTAGANPAGLNDTFADALSLSQNTSQTVTGPISFGGAVTAPTRTAGDNSTNVATTAFVRQAVSGSDSATNVKDHGALGDGVTDDSVAIAAAVAIGGWVVFPPGNYLISNFCNIPSNTHILGYGATITAASSGAAWAGGIVGPTFYNQAGGTNITIEGLTFAYPHGLPSTHIISMQGASNIRLINNTSDGAGNFSALVGCSNTLVQGNTATNFSNAAYDHWGGAVDARVVSNYCSSYAAAGAGLGAIQFTGINTDQTAAQSFGFVCTGNVIYINNGNSPQGIIVNTESGGTADKFIISNNRIIANNVSTWGVLVTSGNDGIIEHNYFEGAVDTDGSLGAIATSGSTNVVINYNVAVNWHCGAQGVFVNGSTGGTLIGNQAYNCSQLFGTNGTGIVQYGNDTGTGTALFTGPVAGWFGPTWGIPTSFANVTETFNALAGKKKTIQFQSSGSNRWAIRSNDTTESGSNAGSDLDILAYADDGVTQTGSLSIIRSTGEVVVGKALSAVGNLNLGWNGSGGISAILNASAGHSKSIEFQTAGLDRWFIGSDSSAESGANAGSNFKISAVADNGLTFLPDPLVINRATGEVVVGKALSAVGNLNLGWNGAGGILAILNAAAGTGKSIEYQTAGLARWYVGPDNSAESGANAGSDFAFSAVADDGSTLISNALAINRATGHTTLSGLLTGTAGMTMSGGPVLFTVPDAVTNYWKVEGPGVWINAQNAVWSGAELDFASQLWCVGIHSGTSSSGTIYLTEFLIQSDEVQMGVTGRVDGFSFIHQFGGGNCAGHRNGMNVVLTQGAATRSHSLLAINPFFNALQVTAQFAHNEGGTGHVYSGGDPSAGQAFGMGAMVRLTSGATEYTSIAGAEFNVSVATGASTRSKVGIQIVKTSEDQQQGGDGEDCAIGIADQTGAGAYWNDGLAFGSPEAQWPFQAGSTLIKTYPQVFGLPTNCDTGIDFSSLHFQKSVFKAIGVNIDPSGVLQMANEVAIANFRMTNTATGMSIMNDGISTSWVFTVAAAGSGYNINDILTTATGGVYTVASINGSGGVTTVTQIVADISRSPPSNPLATTNTNTTKYTTGGSGCTLNLTWSAQNTLSLNPTAMTLIGPEAVHTRVVTASGAVFCTVADHLVVVNRTTSATANVWLPASPPQGMIVVVKDGKGDAATNNLIVTPDNSPTETIDGAASFTINTNYGRLITMNNGTEWNIISSS